MLVRIQRISRIAVAAMPSATNIIDDTFIV
jgi:hypothetical protein